MFWSKKDDRKADAPASPSTSTVAGDPALDATGAIVRILGKHAFDLDHLNARTIQQQCEQWARHILIATPYPGAEPSDSEHSQQADRNWQGLRDFITQLRRREQTFVTTNFKDMRQVLGDFIDTLGKVIVENEEDQEKITSRLSYLRNVIESNASLDSIKREAMQVVGAIGRIVEVRQQTQRSLLDNLTNRLKSMREELNAARQEMEMDSLTRLYNRAAFDQQLQRTFELHRLSTEPACLLIADLDHFKNINDSFGHPVGDIMLRKFADCCVQAFPRRSDFVARYGGEEFAIILQETALDSARLLAERLLQNVRALRVAHADQLLGITVSIGIAELNAKDDLPGWLRRADQLLYRAKDDGRDRVAA